MAPGDVLELSQDQADREFHNSNGITAWRVENRDAALGGGSEIDVGRAAADNSDGFEVPGGSQHRVRDRGRMQDDQISLCNTCNHIRL